MRARSRRGPRPKEISDLVRDLLRARAPLQDEPTPNEAAPLAVAEGTRWVGRGTAMFLIGAGCSKSAGIPLASEVAKRAVMTLERDYRPADPSRAGSPTPSTAEQALAALVEGEHVPTRYMPVEGSPLWGELYNYIFSEHIKHPNHQRALIANLVDTDKLGLNWSHACLGELVNLRFVHTVLTTNFDQLVLKGIIRTGIIPVVADGLESLIRVSATPRWPQVVHVHGSMHTYELRNSYDSLRETEEDTGLQSLMLSVLKETTVLVVVGYSGGEEGIMTLLQQAATSLPRMVVYWVAYDSDYAHLSEQARALLETGEYKYFILGQDSDEFFNKLLGELGVGPPGWIKRPLGVLEGQAKISPPPSASDDVQALINAYETRVTYAVKRGEYKDTANMEATELRSANRFREAAEKIESNPRYRKDMQALRLHATSLFNLYNEMPEPDEALLRLAIEEFETLASSSPKRMLDTELLIEARRDLYERLPTESDERQSVAQSIAASAKAAQPRTKAASRDWALMEFYKAEASQLHAEHLKRGGDAEKPEDVRKARAAALGAARDSYERALPILTSQDAVRARECKEGLAGALTGLAELRPRSAKANLRQAKALFQEVVEFARRNTPGREFAGALENLAGVVETTVARHPEDAHIARNEAQALLTEAEETYAEIDDADGVQRMQSRLIPYDL